MTPVLILSNTFATDGPPIKKIAEELSLSENTIRSRVNKLRKEGVLEISGVVDPEALKGHQLVMVGVKLKSMNLIKKGEGVQPAQRRCLRQRRHGSL